MCSETFSVVPHLRYAGVIRSSRPPNSLKTRRVLPTPHQYSVFSPKLHDTTVKRYFVHFRSASDLVHDAALASSLHTLRHTTLQLANGEQQR